MHGVVYNAYLGSKKNAFDSNDTQKGQVADFDCFILNDVHVNKQVIQCRLDIAGIVGNAIGNCLLCTVFQIQHVGKGGKCMDSMLTIRFFIFQIS